MTARMALALLAGFACLSGPALADPPLTLPAAGPTAPPQILFDAAPPCRNVAEFDADVLLWWTRSSNLPVLATSSDPADLGVPGAPSTTAVIGGQNVDFNPRIGGRVAGRYLLDGNYGIGVGGFLLENGTESFSAGGLPVLAVPTIDPFGEAPAAFRLAAPGAATGAAEAHLSSRLWGLDANGFVRLGNGDADGWLVDALLGYRFLQLSESLNLNTTTTIAGPGLFAGQVAPDGSTYLGVDSFGTRNSFHGAQLGARGTYSMGRLSVQTSATVGLGVVHQTVNVTGSTTLLAPGLPAQTAPGNFFTQTTNIGQHSTDRFGVVPQVGINVGYQVTSFARLTVGYDFLYVSSVARPGDQIDPVVNPFLPPIQDDGARVGAARPAVPLDSTDFWAQGVTFGLQLKY